MKKKESRGYQLQQFNVQTVFCLIELFNGADQLKLRPMAPDSSLVSLVIKEPSTVSFDLFVRILEVRSEGIFLPSVAQHNGRTDLNIIVLDRF